MCDVLDKVENRGKADKTGGPRNMCDCKRH